MYLAECSGCIATIGRDGKLYFIPFVKPNSNNTHIIPERILNNNMNNIEADSADAYVPLITYDDTCPDDGEEYGKVH